MSELRESSGLHSLAALREHEQQRAEQLATLARARAESEQRARLASEREIARLRKERLDAESAAKKLAESEQRAELARLEAASRAEFERAEHLARVGEDLRLTLNTERVARRTVEIATASQLLSARLHAGLCLAAYVGTCLAAAALYFCSLRPAALGAVSSAQQSLFAEKRAHAESDARNVGLAQRSAELARRVSSLEETLRAERAPKGAPPILQSTSQKTPRWHPTVGTAPPKPCRDDGDPLNPCLKR